MLLEGALGLEWVQRPCGCWRTPGLLHSAEAGEHPIVLIMQSQDLQHQELSSVVVQPKPDTRGALTTNRIPPLLPCVAQSAFEWAHGLAPPCPPILHALHGDDAGGPSSLWVMMGDVHGAVHVPTQSGAGGYTKCRVLNGANK